MRHVFETMGTMASIDVCDHFAATLRQVEGVFRAVDERFSLFKNDSELSHIASGALALTDSSDAMLDSYARALEWRTSTGGLFSPHRPDGVLDLNGIVKAEAIRQAGAVLDNAGCARWTINVGGDVLARSDDEPWNIGIADGASARLLTSVPIVGPRRAVATSGSAHRGDHIWSGGRLIAAEFTQVSVLADDIITADVLATAIVAGGSPALDEFADRWPIDVLAVARDGSMLATPGFRRAMRCVA